MGSKAARLRGLLLMVTPGSPCVAKRSCDSEHKTVPQEKYHKQHSRALCQWDQRQDRQPGPGHPLPGSPHTQLHFLYVGCPACLVTAFSRPQASITVCRSLLSLPSCGDFRRDACSCVRAQPRHLSRASRPPGTLRASLWDPSEPADCLPRHGAT